MSSQTVLTDRRGDVALLTLNRPRSANAVDIDTAELLGSLTRSAVEDGARALVLAGSGSRFCAGGDLRAVMTSDDPEGYLRRLVRAFEESATLLSQVPVPVVAAVHGVVAGAGLALMLNCDVVVAARSTRFMLAYAGAGLTPDCGVSYLLPRAIGLARALDMAVAGRELTSDRAMSWGLITHIADDDTQGERALKVASDIATGPTAALAEAAQLMRSSADQGRELSAHAEAEAILRGFSSADAVRLTDRFRQP